ncbi:MAG: hypothetical protein AAFU79_14500 [Myxococcota bacterium]
MTRAAKLRRWAPPAALALGLAGCATPGGSAGGPRSLSDFEVPSRPGAPAVLALMPNSPTARETFRGLVEELGEDVNFRYRVVDEATTPERIARWVRTARPRAVVVMNNPTLRVYRRYQTASGDEGRNIPVVGILTSFLRESGRGVQNLGGVIYEVPLLTSVVNLRSLVDQPVRRVGVLHRRIFGRFLDEQGRLAAPEGVELVPVEIENATPTKIREGLARLRLDQRVDAIWILNDNRLLTRELVRDAWLPALRDNATPVIVNVRSLLSSRVDFGSFAVLPDHFALGAQAGQMLANIADRGWTFGARGGFEYPVAVRKVLDVGFARENLALVEDELRAVDELVE